MTKTVTERTRIVLDSSVTVGWVHEEQATDYSQALLEARGRFEAIAPALWALEFPNVLLVLQRRRKITDVQRRSALARSVDWRIALDTSAPDMLDVSDLAVQHDLSTYDAAYLACSMHGKAWLACQDASLKKAAIKLGCWFDGRTISL